MIIRNQTRVNIVIDRKKNKLNKNKKNNNQVLMKWKTLFNEKHYSMKTKPKS